MNQAATPASPVVVDVPVTLTAIVRAVVRARRQP